MVKVLPYGYDEKSNKNTLLPLRMMMLLNYVEVSNSKIKEIHLHFWYIGRISISVHVFVCDPADIVGRINLVTLVW